MNGRRVVVTGMGIVSPLGNDLASNWDGVCNGRSGIHPVAGFDASTYPTRIAGEIRDFDVTRWVSPKDARKMEHFIHYGIAAALMAKEEAGLDVTEANAERIGALVGAGIGGIWGIEETAVKLHEGGVRKISPFYIPSTIINMLPGQLSLLLGLKGPTFSVVSACASANHSIGMAMRMIQCGDADVMFAGGAERGSSPTAMGGFCAMKAMSTRNDDPTRASRPWDADRDGFVLGDGAGVLVLEEYEHARARGAHIHCELAGFGASSDAFHMTAPSENGDGPARCMVAALRDAGVNPEDIGYLNAHGTSTPLGDLAETHAIRRAFGAHADRVMVSSTKSMTGHLLGAAGAVEAAFAILALRNQVVPPTANYEVPDPDCDLDYVANTARPGQLEAVMSNSLGFGGHNSSLIFRTYRPRR